MNEQRFTRGQRVAGIFVLLAILTLESVGGIHFMSPARPVVVLASILVGFVLGLGAVLQYISDDFAGPLKEKPRSLSRELRIMLPPTIFALLVWFAFSHQSTGAQSNTGILQGAANAVIEGIWPLLIVVTATIIVATLAAWYLRSRLESRG